MNNIIPLPTRNPRRKQNSISEALAGPEYQADDYENAISRQLMEWAGKIPDSQQSFPMNMFSGLTLAKEGLQGVAGGLDSVDDILRGRKDHTDITGRDVLEMGFMSAPATGSHVYKRAALNVANRPPLPTLRPDSGDLTSRVTRKTKTMDEGPIAMGERGPFGSTIDSDGLSVKGLKGVSNPADRSQMHQSHMRQNWNNEVLADNLDNQMRGYADAIAAKRGGTVDDIMDEVYRRADEMALDYPVEWEGGTHRNMNIFKLDPDLRQYYGEQAVRQAWNDVSQESDLLGWMGRNQGGRQSQVSPTKPVPGRSGTSSSMPDHTDVSSRPGVGSNVGNDVPFDDPLSNFQHTSRSAADQGMDLTHYPRNPHPFNPDASAMGVPTDEQLEILRRELLDELMRGR